MYSDRNVLVYIADHVQVDTQVDEPTLASPAAPHSSTAAKVLFAGLGHLTHALALNATLPPPLGRGEGAKTPAAVR